MKNKLIFLFALGMFLISLNSVSAQLKEGDILTQSQVNSINFTSVNLDCKWVKNKDGKPIISFRIYRDDDARDIRVIPNYHCLTLKKLINETVQYNVTRQRFYPEFLYFKHLNRCNPRNKCILRIKSILGLQILDDIETLRQKLKDKQTYGKPNENWWDFLP